MRELFGKWFTPKLRSPDKNVRLRAIEKLANQRLLSEVAETDRDEDIRLTAVKKLTDRTILRKIAEHDSDLSVRAVAHEAMTGTSAISFLTERMRRGWPFSTGATAALGKIGGAQAIPHLIGALRSYSTRQDAAEALAKLGQMAIPAMLDAIEPPAYTNQFDYENNEGWKFAAVALGKVGDSRAIPALKKVVQQGSGDAWQNYREDGSGRFHLEYRNRWVVEEAKKLLLNPSNGTLHSGHQRCAEC